MKKVLLTSFIFLITTLSVLAYETVIIKFPQDEVWHKSFYKKIGLETILQYVPRGETFDNWNRTIVVHSCIPIKKRNFSIVSGILRTGFSSRLIGIGI